MRNEIRKKLSEMGIAVYDTPDGLCADVEGDLVLQGATQLRDAMLELAKSEVDLCLDLSRVANCDSAGIQVLIMMKREAALAGYALTLTNHSAAILRLLDLYGLAGYFADPIRIKRADRSGYGFHYGMKRQVVTA